MFVQEFEAADYLALHLPWDLEIFTKDADIHHLKILEIQGFVFCWTIYSKTFQVHLNGIWKIKYKFLDGKMKFCWEEG